MDARVALSSLIGCLAVSGSAIAGGNEPAAKPEGQPLRVTFSLRDVPLRAALQTVLRGTDRKVMVDANVPDVPITLTLREADADAALRIVARLVRKRAPLLAMEPAPNGTRFYLGAPAAEDPEQQEKPIRVAVRPPSSDLESPAAEGGPEPPETPESTAAVPDAGTETLSGNPLAGSFSSPPLARSVGSGPVGGLGGFPALGSGTFTNGFTAPNALTVDAQGNSTLRFDVPSFGGAARSGNGSKSTSGYIAPQNGKNHWVLYDTGHQRGFDPWPWTVAPWNRPNNGRRNSRVNGDPTP